VVPRPKNQVSSDVDLWSSTAPQSVKESALALFKEDLEAAALDWADNRAKSKKYAAIGEELAESLRQH
jgi:hypothetical protein